MANTIQIKRSTGSVAPTGLAAGEFAYVDGLNNLYIRNAAGSANVVVGGSGTFAPLGSPALTGNPTTPTATPGDNDTSIASTAFVTAAIAASVTSNNDLGELADVTLAAEGDGHMVLYDSVSGDWENQAMSGDVTMDKDGVTDISNSGVTAGTQLGLSIASDGRITGRVATVFTDISNFDVGVQANRLDEMATPTATVSMGSQLVSNVLTPVSDNDAVNKAYADSIASGLDPKESVRVCTITDVSGTYATTPSNGRLTAVDLTSDAIFDGVPTIGALLVGERVLLSNQTDAKENGIYTVTTAGAAGVLTRAADQDGTPANEVSGGNYTFCEEGTANANGGFVLQGAGNLTLNTDNLDWVQFSGAGSVTAGDGLDKAGNTLSVDVTDVIDTAAGLTETSNNIQVNLDPSGGLEHNSTTGIRLEAAVAGDGLAHTTGVLSVNVGVGIEINADTLRTNVNQSHVTSLGTITTGVWQGTTVAEGFGGTGQSTYTTGDVLFSNASNSLAKLGIGSSGQFMKVVSGIPAWSDVVDGGTF